MLRRYAAAYENVHGPLPRDERGGRVYPVDAVQRMLNARTLLQSKTVLSLADAFNPETSTSTGLPAAPLHPHPDAASIAVIERLDAVLTALENAESQRNMTLNTAEPSSQTSEVLELHRTVLELERRNRLLVEELRTAREELQKARQERTFWERLLNR